jgi:hypothetical protein
MCFLSASPFIVLLHIERDWLDMATFVAEPAGINDKNI